MNNTKDVIKLELLKTDSGAALIFYSPLLADELRQYVKLKQRRTRNWIDKLIIEKLKTEK
jgi:hypothetical protein